ncbi:DUF402 domain-containing protein [Streptomyces sp. NPDC059639]|uniref:DUF402 domain-containing protein n=1 Tax=Streptomyces sp. NPDC059639 TaxID=3346891 RepID=UPI00368A39C3
MVDCSVPGSSSPPGRLLRRHHSPTWSHKGEVAVVDLDLDVCRIRQDGSVFVDDEDEFANHQRQYGYPRDVITHAESTAEWLSAALRDGTEPFRSRYRTWLDQVG